VAMTIAGCNVRPYAFARFPASPGGSARF
jgi:hypothetical protein